MYSATKCGVLGMTRSLAYPLAQKKIRVAIVHPFFTGSRLACFRNLSLVSQRLTDTTLLDTRNRVLGAGLAFVPIERVGGTIILAATDRDMSTTGAAWVLPDGGPLLRLESEAIKGGVYDILTNRAMQFEA
jgi:NAD(P)-dependent dehydrogenase (short-subunit alcohol dehydrogenase family)